MKFSTMTNETHCHDKTKAKDYNYRLKEHKARKKTKREICNC